MTSDADDGLPAGWSVGLAAGVRRTDRGRTLIGGAPLRILRFTDAGARWLDHLANRGPLPSSVVSRRLARRLVDAGLADPTPPPGTGRLSRDDVAVVIPVRDAADGLRRTLATIGPVGEVVVVDDGSHDRRAVQAAMQAAACGAAGVVLRNDRSLGPGAARQRGWRATTRPIVVFVDTDVTADGDWLFPLLAHLGDPQVGAVAPRVVADGTTAPQALRRYEDACSPLDLGPCAGMVGPGYRVPYVPTAALAARRTALVSVDGFDEELRVGEDVDLVWRLHARGWRVRYEPAATVRHPTRPDYRTWTRQRFTYGTSAAPLAQRHGGVVAPLVCSGWSAITWAAIVARRPALALAMGLGTTAALMPKLRGLEQPVRESLRLAGAGHLWAGRVVANALWRAWWPLTVALAAAVPRLRATLLAALLVPPVLQWRERRPAMDPLRFLALHALDDACYGTGLWVGCLRTRSARALLPSFSGPLDPPSLVGLET